MSDLNVTVSGKQDIIISVENTGAESVNITVSDSSEQIAMIQVSGPQGPAGPPGGGGGGSTTLKSGLVPGGSFSGNPKKFSVVFATAYTDDQYAITLGGTSERSYSYSNKTAAGFDIETNANQAISGEVSWITIPVGET